MVNLNQASAKEINKIAELAEIIWHQHYPSIISIEQINYMLNKMYHVESLKKQMNEGHEFYLIGKSDTTIGFISISKKNNDNDLMIHKFYLLQEEAGKGTGSAVFKRLIKETNPRSIELTVNRQNYKSINFYFKNGFSIKEVADFDIGNGFVMNDFVMVWGKSKN